MSKLCISKCRNLDCPKRMTLSKVCRNLKEGLAVEGIELHEDCGEYLPGNVFIFHEPMTHPEKNVYVRCFYKNQPEWTPLARWDGHTFRNALGPGPWIPHPEAWVEDD